MNVTAPLLGKFATFPKNTIALPVSIFFPPGWHVDAVPWTGRTRNSQVARSGLHVVAVPDTVEFARLEISPLARHPEQFSVSILDPD